MITTRSPSALIGGCVEVAGLHPVRHRQVVHGLVDAGQVAAREGDLAGRQGAGGEHDGVELRP